MNKRHWITIIGCLLAVASANLWAAPASADGNKQDKWVAYQAGSLPIILSAPHGGNLSIPGVPPRQGKGVKQFVARADSWTAQLTEKMADEIEMKTGKRPYVVIARFHRKYIDANRPPKFAYESDQAKPTYDAYHQALAKARAEVIKRWGRGILLDIHGQGSKPKVIFRGTQNGRTTTHLIKKFGKEALTGKSSLFGQIAKQGFSVIPATDSPDRENSHYKGGYISVTYGSMKGGTMDAIQLELGKDLRAPRSNANTAKKLANAIDSFAKKYLPAKEKVHKPLLRLTIE